MRKVLLAAACLTIFLTGCKANEAPPSSPSPSVIMERSVIGAGTCEWKIRMYVDNSFTPAETMDIGQALSNWNHASGGRICFTVAWSLLNTEYEKKRWRTDGMNTIYSGARDWHRKAAQAGSCKKPGSCSAVTFWQQDEKAADIFYLSRNRIQFRALTEHEVGHVLGLWHSKNPHDLMYGTVVEGFNYNITNNDKEMLRCLMNSGEIGRYTSSCRPKLTP